MQIVPGILRPLPPIYFMDQQERETLLNLPVDDLFTLCLWEQLNDETHATPSARVVKAIFELLRAGRPTKARAMLDKLFEVLEAAAHNKGDIPPFFAQTIEAAMRQMVSEDCNIVPSDLILLQALCESLGLTVTLPEKTETVAE